VVSLVEFVGGVDRGRSLGTFEPLGTPDLLEVLGVPLAVGWLACMPVVEVSDNATG
jgi:hypothetical protein